MCHNDFVLTWRADEGKHRDSRVPGHVYLLLTLPVKCTGLSLHRGRSGRSHKHLLLSATAEMQHLKELEEAYNSQLLMVTLRPGIFQLHSVGDSSNLDAHVTEHVSTRVS